MSNLRPDSAGFVECDTCRAKPGTPALCAGCLHNREVMHAAKEEKPMTEYRWHWMKPDRPGVWLFGQTDRTHQLDPNPLVLSGNPFSSSEWTEGWWVFICDLPTIQPPLPQLTLPAGLIRVDENLHGSGRYGSWRHSITVIDEIKSTTLVRVIHEDEQLAIRAVQAAVDVLSE